MMIFRAILVSWCSLILISTCLAKISEFYLDNTEEYFANLTNDNKQKFLKELPKGADLHIHLVGAPYPDWLIGYAALEPSNVNWCAQLDRDYTVYKGDANGCINAGDILLRDVERNTAEYNSIVSSWTMSGFDFLAPMYGHDHFFAAFQKTEALADSKYAEILASLMDQAKQQHIHHIEVMVKTDVDGEDTVKNYASRITTLSDSGNGGQVITYDDMREAIWQLEGDDFEFTEKVVKNNIIVNAKKLLNTAKLLLIEEDAEEVKVLLKYTANRGKPLREVFAALYAGFLAHQIDQDLFGGIDLIAPEDSQIALNNYDIHMKFVQWLKRYFTSAGHANISLHAGELTHRIPIINDPSYAHHLTYHIYDAAKIAGAQRIGHGAAFFTELYKNSDILALLKDNIAMEICLTSNEQILGACDGKSSCSSPTTVKPSGYDFNHPFSYYFSNQIPTILCTDDQGIEGTTLSDEYYKAAIRYELNYTDLKKLSRNSLTYSYLRGKSLWEDPKSNYIDLAADCFNENPYNNLYNDDPSSRKCQDYLAINPKARAEWNLEKEFAKFEDKITNNKIDSSASSSLINSSYYVVLSVVFLSAVGL